MSGPLCGAHTCIRRLATVGSVIVFETHSITEDNELGFATGWLPGRLSATGRELARDLGAPSPRRRLVRRVHLGPATRCRDG